MAKMHVVKISDRIDLYLNNEGFLFTNKLTPPKKTDLKSWGYWKNFWMLYKKDNVEKKVYNFLSSLPERFKTEEFYQNIVF